MPEADYVVIGSGIAGASIASELATRARVIVLERETRPGYHSTGRSATLFSQMYGNSVIRSLSRASRQFLFNPPGGFTDSPLVRRRGMLYFAAAEQEADFAQFYSQPDVARGTRLVSTAAGRELVPILKEERLAFAAYDPNAQDVDANALHVGHLRLLKAHGSEVICDCTIEAIERSGGLWSIRTQHATLRAPVLINAAGAWADQIAATAGVPGVGLAPLRRTIVLVDAPAGYAIDDWPLALDISETLYFKPDAGTLLISPADETPSPPCDAQPDEYDIAVAAERFEQATGLTVRRIRHRWAGLRTFAADRTPIVGFDPVAAGFFWIAGQGGYGIQTAPALARIAAALASGERLPADVEAHGVDVTRLAPRRRCSGTSTFP